MSSLYWPLLLVPWVAIGVAAVVLLLYRRGHRERTWLLLGGILGPFIVPIALERAPRNARRPERRRDPAADETGPDR